eukprot:XP_001699084.1 predicted protein [Chlamydomonas reinhardtii]
MLDAVVLLLVLLFMVKFVCAFVHALKECRGELSRVYLKPRPGEQRSYVAVFKCDLLPLTARGVSREELQGVIDYIVGLLKKCPQLKIDRVHNGGSFGRRTMVRGAFDVDLTVFVNEFRGRQLSYMAGDWSDGMQREMQRAVANLLRDQGLRNHVLEVEHGTHYKHCVNLTARVMSVGGNKMEAVDMDIKLAPNVVQGSQVADRGKAQRDVLMADVLRQPARFWFWSRPPPKPDADPVREAALAEALTAVVVRISDRVKAVCWYKYGLQAEIPNVPSVLLETVVLAAAQRLDMSKHEAEVSLFLAALELLDAAVTRREVVVLEAGPVWGYTRAQAESCRHVWRNDPVVVLHPIDPTCNLAAAGRTIHWHRLASKARALRRVVLHDSMHDLLVCSSLAPAVAAMFQSGRDF